MRYFQAAHLPLPARPRVGPAPYEVVWQPARTSAILDILHNPAYAGAYVYGRKLLDPARRTPGHPSGGRIPGLFKSQKRAKQKANSLQGMSLKTAHLLRNISD